MTTKFLDNKFALSKFYCRGVSHEKQCFGRFSSLPPRPHPLKKRKLYFYCRLAVSERWDGKKGRKEGRAKSAQKIRASKQEGPTMDWLRLALQVDDPSWQWSGMTSDPLSGSSSPTLHIQVPASCSGHT